MADASAVRIVRLLIESGEMTREDVLRLAEDLGRAAAPTHSEFLEIVSQRCPPSSRGTYGTGFRRLIQRFGERPVDAVTTADIDQLAVDTLFAVRAAGHVDGSGAVRNLVHASRFFYGLAHQHGFRRDNPASAVAPPSRHRRVRRALAAAELVELYDVVVSAGDDPLLDLLLLDFHRETAARRGGACALRLCDLRPDRPSVLLREKGGHEREVPASPRPPAPRSEVDSGPAPRSEVDSARLAEVMLALSGHMDVEEPHRPSAAEVDEVRTQATLERLAMLGMPFGI